MRLCRCLAIAKSSTRLTPRNGCAGDTIVHERKSDIRKYDAALRCRNDIAHGSSGLTTAAQRNLDHGETNPPRATDVLTIVLRF